jgi:hypothetical protein
MDDGLGKNRHLGPPIQKSRSRICTSFCGPHASFPCTLHERIHNIARRSWIVRTRYLLHPELMALTGPFVGVVFDIIIGMISYGVGRFLELGARGLGTVAR